MQWNAQTEQTKAAAEAHNPSSDRLQAGRINRS
jgi:hypothetical protein